MPACAILYRAMIRQATEADVPAIVGMGMRFVAETNYHALLEPNPAALEHLARTVLANPQALVLVSEQEGRAVGILAMLLTPHAMTGELIAVEIVWWMDPEARGDGVRMLMAAEGWAQEQGAGTIQMIAPTRRVEMFYERMQYVAVERAYQKRLRLTRRGVA